MLASIAIVYDADNLLPIFIELCHGVFVSNSYGALCRPSFHFIATWHERRNENMKRRRCTSCGQFVGASHAARETLIESFNLMSRWVSYTKFPTFQSPFHQLHEVKLSSVSEL